MTYLFLQQRKALSHIALEVILNWLAELPMCLTIVALVLELHLELMDVPLVMIWICGS